MTIFANPVLLYGTSTCKTETVAELLVDALKPELELEMIDVSSLEPGDLKAYDFILAGIPTWDIGQLEYAWQDIYDEMDGLDLTGTRVAMFGLGDQENYADTYQDAMGILYDKLLACGAEGKLGFTSTDSHTFDDSLAFKDGRFCGLCIDQDNQAHETQQRVDAWAAQLKRELGLVPASV